MEGIIKVNPQELINTSNEFQSRNTAINDITGQMLTLARNLGSQWEGAASATYINKFNELEDDMQMINNKIAEHVKDLQEMAQQYTNAEKDAETLGAGVNANLIS